MIVDSSALIAILFDEPASDRLLETILNAEHVRVSVATALEVSIVAVGRDGPAIESEVDLLFSRCRVELVPVDGVQLTLARNAFLTYGKGRHHPAKLNFGDCFSYALAKATGEPFLFKGDDFTHTDIVSALA